ncbi:regulatory protein RecX [Candidatus Aerophobetes bacterium]|nr:regulatory protein RecX [Candidatus Aerophobetes bacterium]
MNEDDWKEYVRRGKNYALHLLTYCDRSKLEIEEKLKKKQYPEEVIEHILQYLERMRFIDDERFAREWARANIKRGIGRKRIEYGLRKKGVSEKIIAEISNQLFVQIDEKEMALKLLYRKKYLPFQKGLGEEERLKQLAKIYRFLLRRGFPNSIISDIVWE